MNGVLEPSWWVCKKKKKKFYKKMIPVKLQRKFNKNRKLKF